MSHPEQLGFFQSVASSNEDLISDAHILEIGSYDVNGSIRKLFKSAASYTGVDLVEGPSVDRVAYGHQITDADGTYDVVLSGECFEHDPHWRQTLSNMARLTAPGGLLAFSCASRGRPEHGTRRSSASLSPGTQREGLDYYRNVRRSDLESLPLDEWFSSWRVWYLPTNFDLYFSGVRRGSERSARLPASESIKKLRKIMPWPHKVARFPLRVLAATPLNEDSYQRVVLPYWRALLRISGERAIR